MYELDQKLYLLYVQKHFKKDHYKSHPSDKLYLEILELLYQIRLLERQINRQAEF